MKRVLPGIVGVSLIAFVSLGFASWMGGWAVVTVAKIPDAWIAGKPLQLTWQVRQHGLTKLEGLSPTLEATSGSRRATGRTWAFAEDGEKGYRGSITFPEPGMWQVTIKSGFGNSRAVLIPWRVVDSVTPVRETVEAHLQKRGIAPLPEAERGRRMFAATGCVTCHTHRAVPIKGEVAGAGPDLTDRTFPAAYLARYLADPSIKRSTGGNQMPNLSLREKDIAPLVAFINSSRQVTSR